MNVRLVLLCGWLSQKFRWARITAAIVFWSFNSYTALGLATALEVGAVIVPE